MEFLIKEEIQLMSAVKKESGRAVRCGPWLSDHLYLTALTATGLEGLSGKMTFDHSFYETHRFKSTDSMFAHYVDQKENQYNKRHTTGVLIQHKPVFLKRYIPTQHKTNY